MEALEQRCFFSGGAGVHASVSPARAVAHTVMLNRVNGSGGPLVGDRNTWIIVHGLGGAPSSVAALAGAVDNTTGGDQVLVVDWSQLAATSSYTTAVNNTRIVADVLAADIKQLGLSAAHTNLIGFSLGALVAGCFAGDLHSSGGVNRFVALEPVTPEATDSNGHSYTPTLDLAADSRYSIVFHAADNNSYPADSSADDSVLVANVGSTTAARHQAVFDLFTEMTQSNGSGSPDGVSVIFSLTRIMNRDLPAWRANNYSSNYEAILTASPAPNIAPHLLQYRVHRFAHTVTIVA